MNNDYEDYLKKKIFPDLEKGRPNWDRPHTEAVVKHIKAIIDYSPELNLDKTVLVIAGYAHDWGYSGLFAAGKPLSINDVGSAKPAHMKLGAEKISYLLGDDKFSFLTGEQKKRVTHLVEIHDEVEVLKDPDEIVLMEADTLAGLDTQKVKPSFDKDSNVRYMESVRMKRYPLFMTNYGKKLFEKLYKLREKYYENY